MRFKLALLLAAFSLLLQGPTEAAQRYGDTHRYTIQVASFSNPAQARQLISWLRNLGESATASVVDLADRGSWTRVFVGSFASVAEARAHAERLLRAGVVNDFLIRPENVTLKDTPETGRGNARSAHLVSLPVVSRFRIASNDRATTTLSLVSTGRAVASGRAPVSTPSVAAEPHPSATRVDQRAAVGGLMPVARRAMFALTLKADARFLPRPDPVRLAFMLIAGDTRSSVAAQRGGLWVTGDVAEGLARLRWIAGENAAELVSLERDGRVKLDTRLLAKAAHLDDVPLIEGPLAVTRHICSNEGLLLLVQVTQTRHRYRLHIARLAPTHGAAVEVSGGINLDNNFDSRINPHRRAGKKMDNERPPDGFDSLVAINPVARWFNQQTNQVVPAGHIIFHEMAEAHAKLELGLDYLSDGTRPGAHDVALQREQRLKSQRPLSGVVVTAGSNRVLRSEEEVREFFSRQSSQRQ